jgi:predicted O-methyltransferase YrrM
MSSVSDPVTPEHFDYLARRTRGDDPFLRQMKSAALAAGLPEIWVAPEQASFFQIALAAIGAKTVVEVGTLAGSTAIAMARALPAGGQVHTLEIEPRHAAFARDWIARSDVKERITVHVGDAQKSLAAMQDGSVDAILIDADKKGYAGYLKHALRLLRRGGLFFADNAFAFGQLLAEKPTDPDVGTIRAFNDLMAQTAELQAVIVPLGDGFWFGVRR